MDVSFIIVSWNTRALLLDCLDSIPAAAEGLDYEILVVDNGSEDGSTEAVRQRFGDRVRVIENRRNLGFAKANNQALRVARGRCIMLLNSDTVVGGQAVRGLLGFLDRHPDAAMVGPRMVGGDGRAQNSHDNFPGLATELLNKSLLRRLFPNRFSGKAPPGAGAFEVDSLIGACIAVRAEAIRQVGLLDEDYFFFLEETDWCLRMRRAGWKVYHNPASEIIHLQGRSKRRRPAQAWIEYYRSLYLFFKKNRSPFAYRTLRLFRAVKLPVNLILNLAALALTLGLKPRYREKTLTYALLLWWHLRLCPDSMGLRDREV